MPSLHTLFRQFCIDALNPLPYDPFALIRCHWLSLLPTCLFHLVWPAPPICIVMSSSSLYCISPLVLGCRMQPCHCFVLLWVFQCLFHGVLTTLGTRDRFGLDALNSYVVGAPAPFLRVPDAMEAANCAWGAPFCSKTGVFFRTARSIFRIFVLFLVTNFLFLELLPTGPLSRFLSVRDHIFAR